jgi:photosystem II stability/assembly factor-like uncharacterized protein
MSKLLCLATDNGVVVACQDQNVWQVMWRRQTPYRVTCISVYGGDVLIGTTEGISHSDDLGRTWRSAREGLEIDYVRWLAHHPRRPSFVYAGTEPAAIYVSRDGGILWQERPEVAELRDANGWYLPYSPRAGCVRGFAFHGKRGYAAVEQGGLLRSDDLGESWHHVDGSLANPRNELPEGFVHPDVHSVACHPSSPELVFAPTGGGLYRSEDGGQSWERLYRCYCRAVWADANDPQHLIFGPADSVSVNGRIEETIDGGKSWRPASLGLEVPWPKHMVERFVDDGETLFAMLSNGEVLQTSQEVISWQRVLSEVTSVNALAVLRV